MKCNSDVYIPVVKNVNLFYKTFELVLKNNSIKVGGMWEMKVHYFSKTFSLKEMEDVFCLRK